MPAQQGAAKQPETRGRFPTTSWTLLGQVRLGGAVAEEAVAEITRLYYEPSRAFLAKLASGATVSVDDLAHDFLTKKLLSGDLPRQADPSRGSFRHYLKQSLRNFTMDWYRKQGRDPVVASIDDDEARVPEVSVNPWAAEDAEFHRAWVKVHLEAVLNAVRAVCQEKGQDVHWELFIGRYLCEPDARPSWRDLGQRFGMDEKTARNRADTVVQHFREAFLGMLIEETGSQEAAEEELATLLALL